MNPMWSENERVKVMIAAVYGVLGFLSKSARVVRALSSPWRMVTFERWCRWRFGTIGGSGADGRTLRQTHAVREIMLEAWLTGDVE